MKEGFTNFLSAMLPRMTELPGEISVYGKDLTTDEKWAYQAELNGLDPAALMTVSTSQGSYPVYLRRGVLSEAPDLLDLHRRVFLVTDDGIPPAYSRLLAAQCGELVSCVIR